MAKSNMKLLQEALARGDIEAAKTYAEKIEKSQSKGKKPTGGIVILEDDQKADEVDQDGEVTPKVKTSRRSSRNPVEPDGEHDPAPSQAVVRKRSTAIPRPQKGTRIILPQQGHQDDQEEGVLDIYDMRQTFYSADPSSFIAPVYREGAGGTRVGRDGKVMREARKVQLDIDPKKVKFWDPGIRSDGLNPKQRQIDKALAKQTATPRPGTGYAARSVVVKHDVNCDFCGHMYKVYPSELLQAHDEKGRPYLYYKCERCIRGGGR